jgi:YfiH family protein
MENPESGSWLEADWPAPSGVRAGITTRAGGVSRPPFDSFNLGVHVGDDPGAVAENRRRLTGLLGLPAAPVWLNQQHGNRVIDAADPGRDADACHARGRGRVCAILAADCIPLLLADSRGIEIAAVHVGWRGLCNAVAAAAVDRFACAPADLVAWIGPHIGAAHYEVGDDVREACLAAIPGADVAFASAGPRWRADIARMLRAQLAARGVQRVHGGDRCTFAERDLFFSHRRDGRTGRMAALIWLEPGS